MSDSDSTGAYPPDAAKKPPAFEPPVAIQNFWQPICWRRPSTTQTHAPFC